MDFLQCSTVARNNYKQDIKEKSIFFFPFDSLSQLRQYLNSLHDYGRKINIWSANKHSNELHTAILVALSVSSSVQSKNWWKIALIYIFLLSPIQRKMCRSGTKSYLTIITLQCLTMQRTGDFVADILKFHFNRLRFDICLFSHVSEK